MRAFLLDSTADEENLLAVDPADDHSYVRRPDLLGEQFGDGLFGFCRTSFPATRTSLISGIEIMPSGRTTTLPTEAAGSPQTEICRTSPSPIRYSSGTPAVWRRGLDAARMIGLRATRVLRLNVSRCGRGRRQRGFSSTTGVGAAATVEFATGVVATGQRCGLRIGLRRLSLWRSVYVFHRLCDERFRPPGLYSVLLDLGVLETCLLRVPNILSQFLGGRLSLLLSRQTSRAEALK